MLTAHTIHQNNIPHLHIHTFIQLAPQWVFPTNAIDPFPPSWNKTSARSFLSTIKNYTWLYTSIYLSVFRLGRWESRYSTFERNIFQRTPKLVHTDSLNSNESVGLNMHICLAAWQTLPTEFLWINFRRWVEYGILFVGVGMNQLCQTVLSARCCHFAEGKMFHLYLVYIL